MRAFNEMLFHGNGAESSENLQFLLTKLDQSHSNFSGLQQGIDINSDIYKQAMEDIKDTCRDVLASFGFSDEGLQWKELPYPNYVYPRNPADLKIL